VAGGGDEAVADRMRALDALAARGGEPAIRAIEAALSDDDAARVRMHAASLLLDRYPAHRRAIDAFHAALTNEDWWTRWHACIVLKRLELRAIRTAPALRNALADPESGITREAALALMAVAPDEDATLDALERALCDGAGVPRSIVAAHLFARMRRERLLPWLGELMRDGPAADAEFAFEVLRHAGSVATPALATAFESKRVATRLLALERLVAIRGTDSYAVVVKAIDDEEPEVRYFAVVAVGRSAVTATTAHDALVRRFDDERRIRIADAQHLHPPQERRTLVLGLVRKIERRLLSPRESLVKSLFRSPRICFEQARIRVEHVVRERNITNDGFVLRERLLLLSHFLSRACQEVALGPRILVTSRAVVLAHDAGASFEDLCGACPVASLDAMQGEGENALHRHVSLGIIFGHARQE
jgi:HEAT repeat protein